MSDAPSQGKQSLVATGTKHIEVTDDLCQKAATDIMDEVDPYGKLPNNIWEKYHDNIFDYLCKTFGSNGYVNHN